MADTPELLVGGVNYNFEDTTARGGLADLAASTIVQAKLAAGNKTIADLQSWAKTANKNVYWGIAYMTSPYTGWAFFIIVNKQITDSYSEIFLFYNDHYVSSFTSTLSNTTPTWTTKNVNLT